MSAAPVHVERASSTVAGVPRPAAAPARSRSSDGPGSPGSPTSRTGPTSTARPRRRSLPAGSVAGISIFATISALALWGVLFALVLSPWQQLGSQRQLFAAYREQIAAQTIPIGGVIEPGAPVAMLGIPSIDLHDVVVVEGTSAAELQAGPGHRRDTALPGEPGLTVLMGRSELFGAPFGRLVDLRAGDTIKVTGGLGTFEYKVDQLRRSGDPVPAAPGADAARLTLVTSEPGADRFSRETVFVDATLQGAPQVGEPGRPTAIADNETNMAGDQGSMIVLVLWLEALAAAIVALAWANARWGRAQLLLVGVPIVLCTLWGVSESATLLLPNLV